MRPAFRGAAAPRVPPLPKPVLTIFASNQSACAQMCFCCMKNRKNNFIFMCKNKLEYVNYRFFFSSEMGDVRINTVYKLLEILRCTL